MTSNHRSDGALPTRVFFACSGLGHIARGFETHTRDTYEALRKDCRLDAYLFKGGGESLDREQAIWCWRRHGRAANWLGAMARRDGYWLEQTTFALSLIPHAVKLRPDVVYFCDGGIGNLLWRFRKLTRARYKLLLCNGGPLGPAAFPRFDHVHQCLTFAFEESRSAGRSPESQTFIPVGFPIEAGFVPSTLADRMANRKRLGLSLDRPLVLTVAAINQYHKRVGSIVEEIARLPERRPLLVMLGQREAETPAILEMAEKMLGPDGFVLRTVAASQVQEYYDVADAFVLGSVKEGFGRVLVEALARGLGCVAADRPFAREVLGEQGYYADFDRPGEMAKALSRVLSEEYDPARSIARHAAAYDRYSWDRLRPRYVDMIERSAERQANGAN